MCLLFIQRSKISQWKDRNAIRRQCGPLKETFFHSEIRTQRNSHHRVPLLVPRDTKCISCRVTCNGIQKGASRLFRGATGFSFTFGCLCYFICSFSCCSLFVPVVFSLSWGLECIYKPCILLLTLVLTRRKVEEATGRASNNRRGDQGGKYRNIGHVTKIEMINMRWGARLIGRRPRQVYSGLRVRWMDGGRTDRRLFSREGRWEFSSSLRPCSDRFCCPTFLLTNR